MNLNTLQKPLSDSLSIASRFTSSRAQLPILGNIILEAKGNKLTIKATNLEISISHTIGSDIKSEGQIAIPARTITDLLQNIKSKKLELTAKNEQLHIKTDQVSARISGMNTGDFPEIPTKVTGKTLSFKKDQLLTSLSKVLFASSTDDTRPTLTGVYFVFDGTSLLLVSSDGFRLSRTKIKLSDKTAKSNFILPKAILSELIRLGGEDENLIFKNISDSNLVVFKTNSSILSGRVIEGDFPDYKRIIPPSFQTKLKLDKDDFWGAIKTASVFARESANTIKLLVKDSELLISAESSKSGQQSSSLAAKVDGGLGVEISFNYRFIEDFLQVVEGNEIELELNDATSPGSFKDPADPNYLHLIMPVKPK